MILGIHHTSITTPDVDRLASFYCDQLGFETVSRSSWDAGNKIADAIYDLENTAVKMVMLKTSNSYLELFQFNSPTGMPSEENRPICNAGVTHICVIVDDAWAEYERLSMAGMVFHCPPQDAGRVGLATYGRDPDGNIVELLQPAPNGIYPQLMKA
jgi:catechol 2,3-dioxygenase-like lactoylglutathione lyase family enzyme